MDKRLQKRAKRQATRAKERKKLSEPDVRTPEEIKAAREASRPDVGRDAAIGRAAAPMRGNRPPSTGGAAKTDA